jgi:hypothetical protein
MKFRKDLPGYVPPKQVELTVKRKDQKKEKWSEVANINSSNISCNVNISFNGSKTVISYKALRQYNSVDDDGDFKNTIYSVEIILDKYIMSDVIEHAVNSGMYTVKLAPK